MKHGARLHVGLAVVPFVCGLLAYNASGVGQSLLIEACIGLVLLSGLEYVLRGWLDATRRAYEKRTAEIEEHRELVDEAEQVLDPMPGHGFGEVFPPEYETAYQQALGRDDREDR